jgi:hypothetical protein
MTKITSSAFSTSHPLTFARGRNGDVYGVNGEDRGFRWDGLTAEVELLGITGPTAAPTLKANLTSPKHYVAGIDVVDGGYGYDTVPALTLSGSAKAKVEVLNGRVHRAVMQDYGSGYTAPPTITVAGPDGAGTIGSGAAIGVTVSGSVAAVLPTNLGSGYTSAPAVSVSGSGGALLRATINADGQVDSMAILNPGSGYTSTPTLSFSGGGGSAAAGTIVMNYRVTGVTVTASGSGYGPNARVRFTGDGGGAAVDLRVTTAGAIASPLGLLAGGSYRAPPTAAVIQPESEAPRIARLVPVMRPALRGKYWAAIRYVDDTTPARGGPLASSISPLTDIELTAAAGTIDWSWSNTGMEARVHKIELWRSTSDQALVLYRVAVLDATATSYADTVGDNELINPERLVGGKKVFGVLPVVLPNGQVNARRFQPPPRNKRVIAMYQDRAWYGVDVPGKKPDGTSDADYAEPNSLYFSEVDEPESVPETNEIVIQENVKGQDKITALMPYGGGLVVFQTRHAYRLSYAAQPVIDASVQLITQRGCLNQRCWDVHEGVAYVADSMGLYALRGTEVSPISSPVNAFWSDPVIDYSASKWFFVRVDPVTDIVRFHFALTNAFPDRALCYHPTTQAWWLEVYAQTFAAGECLEVGGRQRLVAGGQAGGLVLFDSGAEDLTTTGTAAVACTLRTGNMSLTAGDADRAIRVLYRPTAADCTLNVGLHYNNSAVARPAAIRTDRGIGFTTDGGQSARLNLKLARSPLGDATGQAACHYAGRVDDRSAGADRHLAVALSLQRPAAEPVVLFGLGVSGVG